MKKIFGNHLGIVISDASQDPENRGRCQIFIPHISSTLYKNWNEELKDIDFTHMDKIPQEIIKRLKLVLPWAECAAPIYGGGTSAVYNEGTGIVDANVAETMPDNKSNSDPDPDDLISIPPENSSQSEENSPQSGSTFDELQNGVNEEINLQMPK